MTRNGMALFQFLGIWGLGIMGIGGLGIGALMDFQVQSGTTRSPGLVHDWYQARCNVFFFEL